MSITISREAIEEPDSTTNESDTTSLIPLGSVDTPPHVKKRSGKERKLASEYDNRFRDLKTFFRAYLKDDEYMFMRVIPQPIRERTQYMRTYRRFVGFDSSFYVLHAMVQIACRGKPTTDLKMVHLLEYAYRMYYANQGSAEHDDRHMSVDSFVEIFAIYIFNHSSYHPKPRYNWISSYARYKMGIL